MMALRWVVVAVVVHRCTLLVMSFVMLKMLLADKE
jgi:hypothetical protein